MIAPVVAVVEILSLGMLDIWLHVLCGGQHPLSRPMQCCQNYPAAAQYLVPLFDSWCHHLFYGPCSLAGSKFQQFIREPLFFAYETFLDDYEGEIKSCGVNSILDDI